MWGTLLFIAFLLAVIRFIPDPRVWKRDDDDCRKILLRTTRQITNTERRALWAARYWIVAEYREANHESIMQTDLSPVPAVPHAVSHIEVWLHAGARLWKTLPRLSRVLRSALRWAIRDGFGRYECVEQTEYKSFGDALFDRNGTRTVSRRRKLEVSKASRED